MVYRVRVLQIPQPSTKSRVSVYSKQKNTLQRESKLFCAIWQHPSIININQKTILCSKIQSQLQFCTIFSSSGVLIELGEFNNPSLAGHVFPLLASFGTQK